MRKRLIPMAAALLCLLTLSSGCSTSGGDADLKKDAMDPESMKVLKNPPPGAPSLPPPGGSAPGKR